MTQMSQSGDDSFANWRAYHLFYHADRSLMLRELINPLVSELVRSGLIERFYFIRYGVGGPHVRLRWRAKDETSAVLAETRLGEQAAQFLARWPSSDSMPPEKIRLITRSLLRSGHPEAELIFSDNSWHRAPLDFEFKRYGGTENFDYSLDMFCLSSIWTLQMLKEHEHAGAGWIRSAMLRMAVSLAWGLAKDEDDLMGLADYCRHFFDERVAAAVKYGDEVFARQTAQIIELLGAVLENLTDQEEISDLTALAAGAGALSGRLAELSPEAHRYLAISHIHMTANRLGLTNPEEVYLSRMLWRGIRKIRFESPQVWRRLWDRRSDFIDHAQVHSLAGLAEAELNFFAASRRLKNSGRVWNRASPTKTT
jgi:lantibiotic biosynthesis dehydratase-like protein